MFTEEDLKAYKAKDNAQKAERERVKKEMAIKVIDANNKVGAIVKSFQQYVEANHTKLIGKKLFLVGGGCSDFFNKFFDAWKETLNLNNDEYVYFQNQYSNTTSLKIGLTVRGGQCKMNNPLEVDTAYYKKIEATVSDVIKINDGKIYDGYDVSERYANVYDYESYQKSLEANELLRGEIKELESRISYHNLSIPYQLREN